MSDSVVETVIVITNDDEVELLVVSINNQFLGEIDEQALIDEILPDLSEIIDEPINIDVYQKKRTNLH